MNCSDFALADSEWNLCKSAVLMLCVSSLCFLSFRRRIGVEGYVGFDFKKEEYRKKKRKRKKKNKGSYGK